MAGTDHRIGTTIAGYRIEAVLGRGGMGVVYRAEQVALGRKVALKVLAPELADEPRFRERFLRESQIAASLEHPNIVPIHEAGEAGGVLFIAMRYVEGTDLRSLIASGGRLEPGRAVRIVAHVAEALDVAHDRGLVHRDVKPSNILLTRAVGSGSASGEHVYLSDFGLTKRSSSDSGLTGTGQFIGTIDYAAPEQIEGKRLDARADVYSLGCVLYECLTGRRPFTAENEAAVMYAHLLESPPKPTADRSDLPDEIDIVIAKALAKEPDQRYQTTGELAAAAASALGVDEVSLRPRRAGLGRRLRRQVRRRPRVAAILGLALAIVLVLFAIALPLVGGGGGSTFRPGTVLLDLDTGRQTGFIPPARIAQPAFPLYAGGHFWLANFTPSSFVQIDPSTAKIVTQFSPPSGSQDSGDSYQPYAIDGSSLWLGSGHDLVRMDTRLGKEVDRFHLDSIVGDNGPTEGVAIGGDLVWVSRDVGAGQVVALDPTTQKVEYRFDDVSNHVDIAFGDGLIWTADFGGVNVIDPSTDTVTPVRDITHTSRMIVAGGGYGWTSDPAKGVVYKIDRDGRLVATYRTGLGANGLSFSDGVLWVANEDEGTVVGIDAITGSKTTYRFDHPVGILAAGGSVLLAALAPGGTVEDRIDALSGRVLKLFSQQGELGQGDEPALNWNYAAFQIDFATCAKLLNYPDEPAPGGLQLRPEVAAAMPTLSPDGRTYTFTVRPGYRFSPPSNEPLTAETFRYTIERALSPKLGDFQPASYFVDDIEGEQAFLDGKTRHISGLRVSGDQLSITLTEPSADFLGRLTLPFFCPVPAGTPIVPGGANIVVGGPEDKSIPAAGPYYVADYNNDRYVILKRNPNYHGPRPQTLDAIVLREGLDAGIAVDRIQHEGWDGIVSSGHNGSVRIDPLLVPEGPLASRYGGTSSSEDPYIPVTLPETGFIALNASRSPFADPAIRRAASLAIGRAAVAAAWDQLPNDRLLPPGFPGVGEAPGPPPAPDPAKAAALMKGRRFDIVMATWKDCDPCSEEADAVRAALARIGIRVKVESFADAFEAFRAASDPRQEIELIDSGTFLDYPDSASFLEHMLLLDTPEGWLSPDVRRQVESLARLSGPNRQRAAAALADELIRGSVPVIAYGNDVQGEFLAPDVGCRVFPPFSYGVDLAALCLSGGEASP